MVGVHDWLLNLMHEKKLAMYTIIIIAIIEF